MDLEELNFEKDTKIDESALDVELLIQSEQLMRYSQLVAQAKKEWDEAGLALEVLQAKLDKVIRETPAKYGVDKITETAIVNIIRRQKVVIEAEQAIIDARYNYNVVSGAFNAIKTKGDNLSNLVKLHGAQYFAGPSSVVDISVRKMNFLQKLDKAQQRSIGKRLTRTKEA